MVRRKTEPIVPFETLALRFLTRFFSIRNGVLMRRKIARLVLIEYVRTDADLPMLTLKALGLP